jgi:predicted P-loop ATPase/GTPase
MTTETSLEDGDRLSSKRILVVGLLPESAGKSTLCKALIYGVRERGVSLVPFKPHSGISFWSQFDTFQESLTRGSLLSSDIVELEHAADSHLPLEILNPVNRLSRPVLDRGMPEEKLVFQEFVAERFTRYDGNSIRNVYFLNGTMNLSRMRGMREFFMTIRKSAEKVVFVRNFQHLVKAYVDNFEKATSTCYRRLEDKPLIIESFNDAAYPFIGAEDCDVVLCVSSNTVLRFKAEEYFKAIESSDQRKTKLQLTTSDVYAASLVELQYDVQPLTDGERKLPTRLVENYSKIIDDLMKQ